ncbi:putative flavin reductase [Mycena venus]|uniref:Putative flavin reductase n=1 Tax=Mycena venus TaxID=2733690 RepID=A0A8H6YA27_9AGAR|nr:putative flavin reductase [Mycena venus]
MAPKRKPETPVDAEAPPAKRNTRSRGSKDASQGGRPEKLTDNSATGKRKSKASGRKSVADDHAPEQIASFQPYPISKVYRLIEPGPVLLVTTGSLVDGTHNVMTIGFHMVMQHESPPLIGICLGPWDASFAALKKHRECVLAVPSVEMAPVVVDVGNCSSDDGVDKWTKFGFEALPANKVKAPLVGGPDVIANVECVVEDTKMVGKYSMWVLKVIAAWQNPGKETGRMFHHRGDGTFVVDGEVLNLQERMVKWKEYQD